MEPKKFDFTKGLVKPRTFHLPFAPDKEAQKLALKKSGQGDLDLYDFISEALAAGMAASGYGIEHAFKATAYIPKIALDGIKFDHMRGKEGGVDNTSKKMNPLLPLTEGKSPVTHKYLMSRRLKKVGGNVLQGVSSALSAAPPTAVNIPGTIYHGQALILTGIHVARLEYISKKYTTAVQGDANLVRDWCQLIRTMKGIKTAVRGASLVGSIIPHASIPTSIATSVAKMGIKLTATGACYAAAAHLQLMAYREQGYDVVRTGSTTQPSSSAPSSYTRSSLSPASGSRTRSFTPMPTIPENSVWPTPKPPGARAPAFTPMPTIPEDSVWPARQNTTFAQRTGPDAGPASSIIWEIFTKRGATRLLGRYDVASIIAEPAGWMALADKLLLI
ncbi:hypothetical protein ACELLULO517_12455 [Acidisoma cellulosilytica]|uniref:Uncharacterized protein n=1 Tax=Acidisoma cellulosilyticum TaxID=2802395 RepID=A0A963Z1Z2_9PROT|nr:hypothetical protein [Acidisoma cellulosilyticum]MCB8881049.1 hypothetical protein [Acidisoma cellulosilyticum]